MYTHGIRYRYATTRSTQVTMKYRCTGTGGTHGYLPGCVRTYMLYISQIEINTGVPVPGTHVPRTTHTQLCTCTTYCMFALNKNPEVETYLLWQYCR